MTNNPVQWSEATEAVKQAASIVCVTHVNPDGDAIGSLMGLTLALREMGKKVDAAVDGGVPDFLKFIPGTDDVISKLKHGRWELMISLDASDEERTGVAGAFGRARAPKVINLDHHPTNIFFGDLFLVVPTAVSATEVVYDWLTYMGHPISQPVATALLTGLVTDTLCFRTSNVTANTLSIAQSLMTAGASLSAITFRALSSTPYNVIELWKHAFQSVQLQNSVISGVVRQDDLKNAHLNEVTDGGLVGMLITVNEAFIAVVFKELEDGRVELSFRSKPGFDVGSVAFSLGGGGHRQASGATIPGPLEAAQARVMPLLYEAVANGVLTII
jgi:phosphoesterase RecJ-like protein